MATVNVTSWTEFLEAVAVAGDTVECPEGALWDLTEEDPITNEITIRCAAINGNGTTIKGVSFNRNGGCIQNVNPLTVNELHWDSVYAECSSSFWTETSAMTKNRCKFSAQVVNNGIYNLYVFRGVSNFTSCAMNVSCTNGGNMLQGSNADSGISKFCRYQFYTTSGTSYPFNYAISPFNYCEKCELIVNAPNATRMAYGLDWMTRKASGCVIRGTIGATNKYTCVIDDYRNYYLSAIAESTMAEASDEPYPFHEGIICSDSELRSAAYLSSWVGYNNSGFPLGDGDTDWHTGDPAINGGYPYIPVMLDLPRLELRPVDQLPYITVLTS